MDVSKTSIRLDNGGFLDAETASEQYWNQRPVKGYNEFSREPRFNATARDLNIHKPVSLGDMFKNGGVEIPADYIGSGVETDGNFESKTTDGRVDSNWVMDDGHYVIPAETDPAFNDA